MNGPGTRWGGDLRSAGFLDVQRQSQHVRVGKAPLAASGLAQVQIQI